jgi:hypothetical protein
LKYAGAKAEWAHDISIPEYTTTRPIVPGQYTEVAAVT